ncbi:MAG: flagellin FliC [Bdellovibrionales bacterium]|nr:flagellin FliC [Bdellovibrionales bacterium]NQZ18442.1 flagellin FliC [Bdellovibrionales bacterium]
MSLRIATNIASINGQRQLFNTNLNMMRSLERLSSGYRINKAADDAAGLAISENLRAQIRGLKQANRNANDGISMVQVAEGGLSEVSGMLIRMRELSIQSASDTIGDVERQFTNVEFQQLKSEIQRVAEVTQFNGTPLLSGVGGILDFQIGVHNDPLNDRISFDSAAANATIESLGVVGETIGSKQGAQLSLGVIDDALTKVNAMRANFGALQNRLTSTINNINTAHENLSAANSRIRDTDVAEESATLAKNNILMQAGVSVLGQANSITNLALKLLG